MLRDQGITPGTLQGPKCNNRDQSWISPLQGKCLNPVQSQLPRVFCLLFYNIKLTPYGEYHNLTAGKCLFFDSRN